MASFLPQAQFRYPDNADVSKQLMLLGDVIGSGISDYRKQSLLSDVLKPGPDGKIDYDKAALGLLRMGDPRSAATLSSISGAKEDRAFRQAQAARSQSNADRSFGLQQQQFEATQANTAATRALQRDQFEFGKLVKSQEFQLKMREIDAKNQKLSNILTPGQQAADKKFADEYVQFRAAGGFTDVNKQLKQLEGVAKQLDAIAEGKSSENLTGPLIGAQPDWMAAFTEGGQKALAARQRVEEVVQRNLRAVLGAQFTQEEGKRLIERAYNPQLGEKENASRLRALINQIRTMAEQKQAASDYFEQNGTIAGFKGIVPGIGEIGDVGQPQAAPATPAAGGGVVDYRTYFGGQ